MFNQFGHRRPSLWPDFQIYNANGGVDTQAIVDAEIDAAAGILDFWFFDHYPTAAEMGADVERSSEIDTAFNAYMASSKKNKIKFALLIFTDKLSLPGTTFTHFVAQCNDIALLVQDPQYQRINGKPLIGLGFESSGMDTGHWNEFLSIVGPVYLVIVDGNQAAATALGANAVCSYGPRLLPAGNGQHAFSEQAVLNEGIWIPQSGRDSAPNAIVLQDRRVFMGTSTPWVDQPTQPELVSHVSLASSQKGARLMLIHAWDEIAESGPGITPGVQEGTRYLDAIKWVRTGVRPTTYPFQVNAHSLACTISGTWTYSQPLPGGSNGVQGNYDSDELFSTTTNDFVEFAHVRASAYTLYAATGPGRGIAEIQLNGVVQTTVDLYTVSLTPHVAVWTISGLDTTQTQTVRVRVTGTKNSSSSSVAVGLDSFAGFYVP